MYCPVATFCRDANSALPSCLWCPGPAEPSSLFIVLPKVAVTTLSLAIALPMSIAVFPQEASFKSDSLEPEFHDLRVKDDPRREVAYLYANKGL